MSILSLKNRDAKSENGLSIDGIKQALYGGNLYSAESANVLSALADGSFESKVDIRGIADQLRSTLEPSNESASFANPTGMAVASMLMACAQKPAEYMRMVSNESRASMPAGVPVASAFGSEYDSVYSPESFDNQVLTEHLGISLGLNYKIARQQDAMELIYRTVPLTPEQGGIDIEVPNLYVQNTLRHALDGSESDFGLRRVIDSSIDPEILRDSSTKVLPTHNANTAANFVATSMVTPYEMSEGRRTVTTSALVVNRNINLLGLGQIDSVSRVGQADYSEALDRNVGIANLFLNLGADTLAFDTLGLPFSRFYKGPEQGTRSLKLDFPVTSITIDADSKAYDGADLQGAVFGLIKDGKYKVRLSTVVNGSADVERGTVNINPGVINVMSITNELGELISLTSGVGKDIVDGLTNLKIEGWFPDARLTNTNHRHLGLMLNTRSVKERFLTRVRSPFFVPYPLSEDRDQTIMDHLTFAVANYMNNEGVGTLIDYHERLYRLTGGVRGDMTVGDFEINALPIEGIARYLINPYIHTAAIDLTNNQSIQTADAVKNGQERLINAVRSVAFDILQRTNYENACRYLDGGEIARKWKIALVTSKKIERFMTVQGDSRTLGADLPFDLRCDIDQRLDNVMYMTLVRDGEGVDPLSAGMMLLTPTLVSSISVTRDGTPRNECVVQPRFQHYHLLPIVVKFEVTGVDSLLEQTIPFKVMRTNP